MPQYQVHVTEEAIYYVEAPDAATALQRIDDELTRHTLDRTALSLNIHQIVEDKPCSTS